jgi:hypothetical protein
VRNWARILFLPTSALPPIIRLRALAALARPLRLPACHRPPRQAVSGEEPFTCCHFFIPSPTVCRQPCSRLLRFVLRHSVLPSESDISINQVHKRGTLQVSVLWNVSGTAIAFGAPCRATGVRMGRRCTERMEACGDEASDSDGGRSTPDAQELAHYARPKIFLHSIPTAENQR